MSLKKKVSIKNTVFNFLDDTGMQDHKMQPLLTRWAVDADYKIQSYYAYKRKQLVIKDIDGCSAEIPCEVIKIDGVIAGEHGCDCSTVFDMYKDKFGSFVANLQAGSGFLVIDLSQGFKPSGISWVIQDHRIVFDRNFKGSITIDAFCYQVDEEGFPMINWNHVDAISAYLEWKMAKRTRWNTKLGNISETGIRELYRDWSRLCAECRADDEDTSQSDRDAITRELNNPLSGGETGIWLY